MNMMTTQTLKDRFKTVETNLSKKPWFKKDKWIISVHAFPNEKNAEGVTFHIFKKHWWNEDKQGVHIESYLDLNLKKQKKTYLTIHLLHSDLIPGTKLKRIAFSKPFIDEVYDEVSSWPGYDFRVGKYGQQPFTKFLDATDLKFEKNLEIEIERMCKKLGPVLDENIKSIL
jgi:hypothetical protein